MFGKLLRAAYDTATLPVAAAADFVTLGGALTDREEPYTIEKAKRIVDDVLTAGDDLVNDDR